MDIEIEIGGELPDFEQKAEEVTEQAADTAAELARGKAPVDTGRLRDSIEAKGSTLFVNADYAMAVEYGTANAPAQPFVRPAIRETLIESTQQI